MIYGRQFLEKNTNFLGNICREVKITIWWSRTNFL
jgi:hypothetical protein